jgi:hypothetical protein
LRKAVEATQAERVAFDLKMGQSKPIYNAVMAVRNHPLACCPPRAPPPPLHQPLHPVSFPPLPALLCTSRSHC